MTFAAAGSFLFADSGNLTVANVGIGNLLLVAVSNYSDSTVWCSALSGGGATWAMVGAKFAGVTNTGYLTVFAGTVTATGAGTATPTWSGAAPSGFEINGHEFTSTVGAWAFDVQGNLDSSVNNASWPSLTPASNGELYFGFAGATGSIATGSTAGYVYSKNADSDACAFNPSCPSGVATAPVWGGNSNNQFGIAVLMREPSGINTGLASAAGTAQNATTSPYSLTTGIRYATAAADLGGNYGSWATPQYAEGGP